MLCYDINIDKNKDVKFLECDYLSCVTVRETHFRIYSLYFITNFNFQDKLHKCPICKKGFTTQNELKVHQMTSHQTMPSTPPFLPFKCHLCEKMFQNDLALRAHFLNHLSTSQQLVGKLCQGSLMIWTEHFTQFCFTNYNQGGPGGIS